MQLVKHELGLVILAVNVCDTNAATTINPNFGVSERVRLGVSAPPVMYVRLASSSQFQVGLITEVIPPEQQLHNGRR